MEKVQLREAQELQQGHTALKQQSFKQGCVVLPQGCLDPQGLRRVTVREVL